MLRTILIIFAMMIAIGAGKAIADNLTFYGVLPVTAGGTGVTTSTGSGSNVLNTSPTLAGTVTGPDAGTWTSGGFNSIAKVGIGMAPVNVLDITQNQNATTTVNILNNSNGASALSTISVDNGTSAGSLIQFGTGVVQSGMARPNGTMLQAVGVGGLSLRTIGSAQPIYFGINGVEALRIDANRHQVTSGPTPTCGAGCSSISGNDNAFVVTTGTAQSSITVNFGASWGANPVCNSSSNSTAAVVDISSVSTAAITFGASVALTGALLYVNCRQ